MIFLDRLYPNFQTEFRSATYPEYNVVSGAEWLSKFQKLCDFKHRLDLLQEASGFIQELVNIVQSKSDRYFRDFQEAAAKGLKTDRDVLENYRLKGKSEGLKEAVGVLDMQIMLPHLKIVAEYIRKTQLNYIDSKHNPLERKKNTS